MRSWTAVSFEYDPDRLVVGYRTFWFPLMVTEVDDDTLSFEVIGRILELFVAVPLEYNPEVVAFDKVFSGASVIVMAE